MDENLIGNEVINAAVKMHQELGPWLLETVDEVVNGLLRKALAS
jgi:hypothetical protein